jgi:hypothetical protein
VAEEIISEKKNQRNEEWCDEEHEDIVRLKNIARQIMINRYTRTNKYNHVEIWKEVH